MGPGHPGAKPGCVGASCTAGGTPEGRRWAFCIFLPAPPPSRGPLPTADCIVGLSWSPGSRSLTASSPHPSHTPFRELLREEPGLGGHCHHPQLFAGQGEGYKDVARTVRGRGTPGEAWRGQSPERWQERGRRAGRRVVDPSEGEGKHVLTPEHKGAGKRGVCKGRRRTPLGWGELRQRG